MSRAPTLEGNYPGELVGRLWFAVSGAGDLAAWLRVPAYAALLVFVLSLLALLPTARPYGKRIA